MLLSLIAFVVILGILVFVHEFGHFIVAKLTGMRVDEFALGYPPRLFAKKYGNTTYAINAIPLGGYVRIHGENPENKDEDPGSFQKKSVAARVAVMIAGVTMNLLLAFVVLTLAYSVGFVSSSQDLTVIGGAVVEKSEVYAGTVVKDSPAQMAGIKVGDQLVSINQPQEWSAPRPITNSTALVQLTKQLQASGKREIVLHINRNGKQDDKNLTIATSGPALGIGLDGYDVVRLPFYKAPAAAVHEIGYIMQQTWGALKAFGNKLFLHAKLDSSVSGPVGIYQATASAAHQGLVPVIFLLVVLSVNLALLNLLPFPPLDGGKLVFLLIEGIFRRRLVAEHIENVITLIGFASLMLLVFVITIQDILRLIR